MLDFRRFCFSRSRLRAHPGSHHSFRHPVPQGGLDDVAVVRDPAPLHALRQEFLRHPGAKFHRDEARALEIREHQLPRRGEICDVPRPAAGGSTGRIQKDGIGLGDIEVFRPGEDRRPSAHERQIVGCDLDGLRVRVDGHHLETCLRKRHRIGSDATADVPHALQPCLDETRRSPARNISTGRLLHASTCEPHLVGALELLHRTPAKLHLRERPRREFRPERLAKSLPRRE